MIQPASYSQGDIADDDLEISSAHCGKCLSAKGPKVYPWPLIHWIKAAGSCMMLFFQNDLRRI